MTDRLRAVAPKPQPKRGRPYNEPGALGGVWVRVVELGSAVREALIALDAGEPAVAREVLVRVERP